MSPEPRGGRNHGLSVDCVFLRSKGIRLEKGIRGYRVEEEEERKKLGRLHVAGLVRQRRWVAEHDGEDEERQRSLSVMSRKKRREGRVNCQVAQVG